MLLEAKRSRRKKNIGSVLVKLLMLLVLIGLIGFVVAKPMVEKWLPSTEEKDLNEWFEVAGDDARIYLDNEFIGSFLASVRDGEIYLPYDFAREYLNDGFYFNENEVLLSYSLPDRTDDYEKGETLSPSGAEAFVYEKGDILLSLGLLEKYTNISADLFTGEDIAAKRIFIYRGGTSYSTASAARTLRVRTSADKKAPVLTTVEKGGILVTTGTSSGYTRVVTEDGIIGYAAADFLTAGSGKKTYENTYMEPSNDYVLLDEKVILGWHTMYSADANSNLSSYYERSGGTINVVAPQWLQISDADGSLVDLSSSSYVEKAHELGLKVWAGVDNVNQPGGISDFSSAFFFGDTAKRRDFIAVLMDKAMKYGYDGFNLDFESLPSAAGEPFVQFVKELAIECHKYGLTLSVDNPVPFSYNSFYNMAGQSDFADYVIIMAYDEHYEGGDPGPVASIGYTAYSIETALDEGVPASHLVIGVPFYTRIWRTRDGEVQSDSMGMAEAETYLKNQGISLSWDEETGTMYGSKETGSTLIEVWLEDDTSLAAKADLMRDMNVAGLAAWRLGIESRDVWSGLDLNSD